MKGRQGRQGRMLVVFVALLALVGLVASYHFFFARSERRESAVPATRATVETLTIGAQSGQVEIAASDGRFRRAKPGDLLSANDQVRTDDDSEVTLHASDGSTIKILGGTFARVAELRRELKKLEFGTGMIEADIPANPERLFELQMTDNSGDHRTVRTRGAAFVASTSPKGGTAVATRRGAVILQARGREVVISTGEYARVLPGQPPEAPTAIPPSLFLKVAWPTKSEGGRVVVSGETTPGARVKIDGRFVEVSDRGRYRTDLHLADGVHQVRVSAEDVGGHRVKEQSPQIVIDTKTDFKVTKPAWK